MADTLDSILDMYGKAAKKGSSILNSIFGLPTSEGIDAQKELMDYEQQLWRERADYDSYAERMKRLREAGLNPDLVVGQGMGSGQVPNMPSTTQLGHGSSGVPAMMNSLTNAALASSQIDANQAKAEKDRADAGKTGVETKFLSDTFGVRFDMLSASLGLKQDERKLLQTQIDTFAAYAEQALAQVSYLRELAMTEQWRSVGEFHRTRSAASEADIMQRRNMLFPQFQDLEMQKLLSEIKLNDATKRNIQQETKFLISSFDYRLQLLQSQKNLNVRLGNMHYRQGKLYENMSSYYNTYDNFLSVQAEYYPFQVIGHIFNDPNYLKTDKDGKVITDSNGMPVIRHGYQGVKVGFDIANDVVGVIKDCATAFGSIVFSSVMKAGRGFQTVAPSVITKPKTQLRPQRERSATGKENDMFNSWVNDAKSNSELDKVFQRINDYKKKHNIY